MAAPAKASPCTPNPGSLCRQQHRQMVYRVPSHSEGMLPGCGRGRRLWDAAVSRFNCLLKIFQIGGMCSRTQAGGHQEACGHVFWPRGERCDGVSSEHSREVVGHPRSCTNLRASGPAPLGGPPLRRCWEESLSWSAAPTNYRKLSGLSDGKLFSLNSGGQKFKFKVSAGHALSEGCKGEHFLSLAVSGGCRLPLVYESIILVSSFIFTWPSSLCLGVRFSLLTPKRILITRLRAHPDPGRSHLEDLTLIIPEKTPFPNKATFRGSGQT